jgi:PAS domain S-box-containing protein
MSGWMPFLTIAGFIPHGHCYLWKPELVWLHVISDSLIAIAYYSIPLTLLYFVRKRTDLPFNWIFLLFGSFIVACGTTHLMAVWTLWHPTYWLSGALKAITATVSIYTAVCLVSLLPKALAFPSLATVNQKLEREIGDRKQTEALLKQAKSDLEFRVAERTAELVRVNQQIQQELDERKQIQSALELSQARFAGILEIASDAIISVDRDQMITLFNQGAEKIFGYKAEEVVGQPLDLLLPKRSAVLHRQHVSGFAQSDTGARRMGERSEIFGRRKDDSEFPAEASISRLKLGSETLFTAILRDISDRKQTELALSQQAAIIESSGDAIISIDLEGNIVSWNVSAERLYGYTSEEMIGRSIRAIPSDRLGEETRILKAIQQGEQIQYLETTRQRKNGTLVEVGLSFSPVRDATNQVIGVSVIARDITDRKQIDRMKDEFVSVVSHELRTPLTSIHGSLGMLASGLLKPDSDQGKRMLQIAVDSTDRLVRLINDILDIERIESGRVKMEKEFCQVDDLLTEAVNVVQALADKAGVTLSIESLPIQVWADPDRIVQTLTNLLSNAVKFSSRGSTVWLTVQQQFDQVLFTVKDQGRGIPSDKLDSIFERFQQVDSSDSRNHEGTGLGLAICRSIVQQHDGRIGVESVLGEGSTFFFTLPIHEHQTPLGMVQAASTCAPLVLICDSDPEISTMLKTLLEQQHYRVIIAASGEDAVAQATTQQPDVILLDLLMPDLNGRETMAQLKEQPETQNIPIIVCSICTESETPPQAAGCVDWVNQPLNESLLLRSLKQALVKSAAQLRALIVEDDVDLAQVLITLFEQHDIETFHAISGRDAICLSQQINPDLLILDLVLPEGDGFTVVDWLRQHDRLRHTPVVVYSAKDLNASERDRLRLGQTEFLSKGQVSIQEFEQRVMALLQQVTRIGQEQGRAEP